MGLTTNQNRSEQNSRTRRLKYPGSESVRLYFRQTPKNTIQFIKILISVPACTVGHPELILCYSLSTLT